MLNAIAQSPPILQPAQAGFISVDAVSTAESNVPITYPANA